MASFQFLTGGGGRQKSEVLEEHYSAADLRAKAVIRDERGGRNRYHVFDSWAAAFEWIGTVPAEERAFHEIVFGGHPQKLKFDVDADAAKLRAGTPAEQDAEVAGGMEELLEAILTELHAAYGPDDPAFRATRQDLQVFDSSGALPGGGWKWSYHVLYATAAVANCEEAKYFTARVLAGLTPRTRALVDAEVNKSLQSFRLAGSAKPGSGRVKRPTSRFGTAPPGTDADTTVGAPLGARVLPRRCTEMSAEGRLSLRGAAAPPPPRPSWRRTRTPLWRRREWLGFWGPTRSSSARRAAFSYSGGSRRRTASCVAAPTTGTTPSCWRCSRRSRHPAGARCGSCFSAAGSARGVRSSWPSS